MPSAGLFHTKLRDEALDHLLAGASVDLIGQRGSGRSTVVQGISAVLVERGWDSVRVRGVEGVRDRPLEALAVAGLTRRADPRSESAVSAAVRCVENAVSDGRTVLVLDDVDDLDAASAGAIIAAHARRPFPILSTSRPRPGRVRDHAARPAEVQPGVQLAVPPLDYVDVHALLGRVLQAPVSADVVARVNAATGGLPGLVVAMARSARGSGRVRLHHGVWTAGADLWDPGLSRVIQPLVTDLDASGVEALQRLSLAGAVPVPTAVELVGWDALEDLDACQLLRFAPQGSLVIVGVYPQLVEQRYRHVPLGASRLRFLERVEALGKPFTGTVAGVPTAAAEATGDVVPREPRLDLPGWFDDDRPPGGDGLSDTVLNRLLRDEWHRAYAARRLDWERDPSPRTAVPYLRSLLVGSADAGLMRDVVARTPPSANLAEMASLHRWHAHMLAQTAGEVDAARALLQRAAPQVGPWAGALEALEDHLTLLSDRLPPERPAAAAHENLQAAQFAEVLRCEVLLAAGRPAEALALLEGARWTDPDAVDLRDVLIGLARLVDGDARGALAWSEKRFRRARAELNLDAMPGLAYATAASLLILGRLGDLRALLGSALSTGLSSSMQSQYKSLLLDTAAVVARGGGPAATVATLAGQARAVAAGQSAFFLTTGLTPASRHDASETLKGAADRMWVTVVDLLDRGFVVSAVTLAGAVIDLAPDRHHAATIRAAVGTDPPALLEAMIRVAEATVDDDARSAARLAPELIDAGLVALGVRAVGATVRRLRASGRTREATEVLTKACGWLERAGEDPDELLSRLSCDVDLTPREREVGKLVAEGLGNPEIAQTLGITAKTVENHVNRVFRKLGVLDRADVAGALRS
ncbi:helix-turn-helix transcriptional regulator [Xylanimonas sp. McL0601]|uniref:helix-turn-helix transcriptional regulator n=1 Tax=Xylanimonas sp. McL0601 TaxID=3414739 RepID=UPI003CF303D0